MDTFESPGRSRGPFPLRQVLVLVEPGAAAANAAWRAALVAREHGAALRILHVHGRRTPPAAVQAAMDAFARDLQQRTNVLAQVQAAAGDVRRQLAAAARDSDLLVLPAAQSARPWREWLRGTQPERLMALCGLPTLVVRRPASVGYRRVLVSVDFDPQAAPAIAVAAAMARGPHAEVLQALARRPELTQPPSGHHANVRADRHRAAQRIRAVVEDLMEEAGARRTGRAPSVVFGHPPAMLLASQRTLMTELVVMPRRPGGRPWPSLPRSETSQVLAASTADVLVLGPADTLRPATPPAPEPDAAA